MFTFARTIVLAGGLAALAAPANAADEKNALTVTGGATLVSDYRFRGISQTDGHAAIQGTLSISHSSGLYATVWGSSIDDYVANGADAELDLILGYKKSFGSTTLDGGVLYYVYPGSGGASFDFAEPYVSITQAIGPLSAKASAAYAPKQKALSIGNGSEDNLYLAGDLAYAIPRSPISLAAHVGHSFGPSYLTIGKEYTDWSLGAAVTYNRLTAGVSYVDTSGTLYGPGGHEIAGGAIIGSIGASF